ncbi:hypothetical protein [Idiomarina piscisalsi]|uniref:Uncharacterized protein n=1 Tax=Idiomarina piscisalsi TaxID=1096243 RepID=A0A432YXF0_9GAMM|nr:hypothetical protein [Idiomarina piscisalsi]RUO67982.1 hypothetical protein CWI73_03760 [Idiomarina piscisalsi]
MALLRYSGPDQVAEDGFIKDQVSEFLGEQPPEGWVKIADNNAVMVEDKKMNTSFVKPKLVNSAKSLICAPRSSYDSGSVSFVEFADSMSVPTGLPSHIFGFAIEVINDDPDRADFLTFGSNDPSTAGAMKEVYELNFDYDQYSYVSTRKADAPVDMNINTSVARVSTDKFLVSTHQLQEVLGSLHIYDRALNSWSPSAVSIADRHSFHVVKLFSSGRVLLMFPKDAQTELRTGEIYEYDAVNDSATLIDTLPAEYIDAAGDNSRVTQITPVSTHDDIILTASGTALYAYNVAEKKWSKSPDFNQSSNIEAIYAHPDFVRFNQTFTGGYSDVGELKTGYKPLLPGFNIAYKE